MRLIAIINVLFALSLVVQGAAQVEPAPKPPTDPSPGPTDPTPKPSGPIPPPQPPVPTPPHSTGQGVS